MQKPSTREVSFLAVCVAAGWLLGGLLASATLSSCQPEDYKGNHHSDMITKKAPVVVK